MKIFSFFKRWKGKKSLWQVIREAAQAARYQAPF